MAKARNPTEKERRLWHEMRMLGCAVRTCHSRHLVQIHHCGTGAGGRKKHSYVIPLCEYHHTGKMGIDRRSYGATEEVLDWEATFGTERELFEETMQRLEMP